MTLLTNLLKDIAAQGSILEHELKNDVPHLFEPKPWKTYDIELPPRAAWEASQKIIADCQELIALLTPTKIKVLTEGTINYVTLVICGSQIKLSTMGERQLSNISLRSATLMNISLVSNSLSKGADGRVCLAYAV
jgi:hypothetical protein